MNEAFITGSHAYGKPTKKSDIDLVVRIDDEAYGKLVALSEDAKTGPVSGAADYETSLRFGKLNLIVCLDDIGFDAWREGTDVLIRRRKRRGEPISRDEAIGVFDTYRKFATKKREAQS